MADGMKGEGELQCNGKEGVLRREMIRGSMYLQFLKVHFWQI